MPWTASGAAVRLSRSFVTQEKAGAQEPSVRGEGNQEADVIPECMWGLINVRILKTFFVSWPAPSGYECLRECRVCLCGKNIRLVLRFVVDFVRVCPA